MKARSIGIRDGGNECPSARSAYDDHDEGEGENQFENPLAARTNSFAGVGVVGGGENFSESAEDSV